LAKACNYTLTLWSRLTRFLEYSVLELSNNLAENAIRSVALGLKNWIHVGSKVAGPRGAAIISVVDTCRRLKIPVRDYLGSVLPGLADFPISRIAELMPTAWANRTHRRRRRFRQSEGRTLLKRFLLRFKEKGGKEKELPVHHKLEQLLDQSEHVL
jgi:hypothetical protein